LAVAAESAAAIQGEWTTLTYRLYYAFGALMVAPWLGAGSIFLIASRRVGIRLAAIVALLSIAGLALIFATPIDASRLSATDTLGFVEVKVFPFIPVRIVIVLGNILGTFAFVGSALYSIWSFRRKSMGRERVGGVVLIALGGFVAASAHSIGALGGPSLFRVSELIAIALIFAGYAVSSFLPRRTEAELQVASSA
jgi:hypothetical protein